MLEYGWGSLEQDYLVIIADKKLILPDFVLSIQKIIQMLLLVEQNTRILIDLRMVSEAATNFILPIGWFFENLPPTVQSIIIINSAPFWNSFFQTSHGIYAQYQPSFHSVQTVDEAYQLLVHDLAV